LLCLDFDFFHDHFGLWFSGGSVDVVFFGIGILVAFVVFIDFFLLQILKILVEVLKPGFHIDALIRMTSRPTSF